MEIATGLILCSDAVPVRDSDERIVSQGRWRTRSGEFGALRTFRPKSFRIADDDFLYGEIKFAEGRKLNCGPHSNFDLTFSIAFTEYTGTIESVTPAMSLTTT